MNEVPIFPLLYAAPISYYAQLINYQGEIDPFDPYTKQNFRSRARIFGANGIITLSIPIAGESLKKPMKDAQISNIEAWQRNHWKSLESAYKSSPFFEFYSYLIQPLYETKYASLWEFNLAFHHIILTCLDIPEEIRVTSEYIPITPTDQRAMYSSKKPHNSSPSFPEYQQVFSYNNKFEPDLSILDGLFNLGPELESYLLKLSV